MLNVQPSKEERGHFVGLNSGSKRESMGVAGAQASLIRIRLSVQQRFDLGNSKKSKSNREGEPWPFGQPNDKLLSLDGDCLGAFHGSQTRILHLRSLVKKCKKKCCRENGDLVGSY